MCRGRLERNFFFSGDELQMIGDQVCRNAVEIEALAAAQDRRQNFLRLGRRENELHVRRRLFQRLEQRVERGGRKHVHFVDEIDLVTAFGRRVTHVVAQLAHVFDAVIARAVDLDDVEAVAAGDLLAVIAHAARRHGRSFHAVERLGQNSRGRGFTDAARSDEQIGVREPVLLDRVLERARDVRLPDQIVKGLGAIFSGEDLVTHAISLDVLSETRKQKSKQNGLFT